MNKLLKQRRKELKLMRRGMLSSTDLLSRYLTDVTHSYVNQRERLVNYWILNEEIGR